MFVNEKGCAAVKKDLFISAYKRVLCNPKQCKSNLGYISTDIIGGISMKSFVVLIGVMFLASCNFFGSSDPNIVFDGSGYVEPSVDSSLTVGDSATLNNVVATINDSIITVRDGDDSGRRIFVNIMVRFENMADNQTRINYGNMLVYDNDRRFRVLRRETIWLDSRTPKLRLDANESYDANFAFRVPDIVDGSIWWEPDEGTMFYIGNIGSGRL